MGQDVNRQDEQSHMEWRVLCSLTFWMGGVGWEGSGRHRGDAPGR